MEAVIGEPVSVSEFPVSRENTGKFCRLRLVMAIPALALANKFKLFPPNSLRIKQGISLTEQGIARSVTRKHVSRPANSGAGALSRALPHKPRIDYSARSFDGPASLGGFSRAGWTAPDGQRPSAQLFCLYRSGNRRDRLDNMSICQTCFGLHGEWTLRDSPQPVIFYQRCRCDFAVPEGRQSHPANWDTGIAVQLCRCCASILLPGDLAGPCGSASHAR